MIRWIMCHILGAHYGIIIIDTVDCRRSVAHCIYCGKTRRGYEE